MEHRNVVLIKADIKKSITVAKPSRFEFQHDRPDSLGRGEEGQVGHVRASIRERSVGGLAFKEYHSEGRAAHALKSYVQLKKAGLPVPSTFRLVKEGERYSGILMTDLTKDWNDVLITSNQTKRFVIGNVFRNNSSTVKSLAEYDIENPERLQDLKARLSVIAITAAKHGIEFNAHDVLSAVYHADGNLEFIISDMGNVHLNSELPLQDLERRNTSSANGILLMISEAKAIAKEMTNQVTR